MEEREIKKITAVTAALVFFAFLVMAGLPELSDAGEIYGCVKKATGRLRIVNNTSQCTKRETAISWNQAGQQGLAGAAGHSPVISMSGDQITVDGVIIGPHLTGPQGPAGTGGGVSGISAMAYAMVYADGTILAASPGVSVTKESDPGTYTITLPTVFQTGMPTCTVTPLFDVMAYLYFSS